MPLNDRPDELRRFASDVQRSSPFYADLLRLLAADWRHDSAVAQLFERHSGTLLLPLRFLAAVNYEVVCGRAPEIARFFPSDGNGAAHEAVRAIRNAPPAFFDALDESMKRVPQTNEVMRSIVLRVGLQYLHDRVRLPVRLFEIGASAGLLLRLDMYRFDGEGWALGDPHADVKLHALEREGSPRFGTTAIEVVERAGCDLNPRDPASEADRNLLLSYVWPDQRDRVERLRRALAFAAAHPVSIRACDAAVFVERLEPSRGTLTTVMQSVIFEHLSGEERRRFTDAIHGLAARAGDDSPVAWLRMERDGKRYSTTFTLWPGSLESAVAGSDGHGGHIVWI